MKEQRFQLIGVSACVNDTSLAGHKCPGLDYVRPHTGSRVQIIVIVYLTAIVCFWVVFSGIQMIDCHEMETLVKDLWDYQILFVGMYASGYPV